jgi:signal transduction histidine kinase
MPPDRSSPHRFRRVAATLRFRVTAVATAVVAVILVLAAVALVDIQRDRLTDSVHERLEQQVDTVAALARDDLPTRLPGFDDETEVRVVTEDDEVVAASDEDVDRDGGVLEMYRRVEGRDGPLEIQAAASLEDVEESTRVLTRSLVVGIPLVLVLLALLVWWLVGRTLRPVEAIRREVGRIGGRELDRRVPVPRGDDEVARLARTMNAMLDRVEDAHRRQERFVADAAHELRSPLTRMRGELEVDVTHPEAADVTATHRSVLEETVALQHLVDDLLQLARGDGGVTARADQPVDLDDIVLRHARRLREDARVQVDVGGVSGAQVRGDPDQLTRVVRNLADNAVRHAHSRVTFALAEDGDVARLTVEDDGPGIPPEAREAVFGRFARLDEARTADEGGAGLGLAITREIVEAHGGTVEVAAGPSLGARLVVTLPLASAPAA